MAAVKLNLNATYYAQHVAMKSVDQKTQSVMGSKLFILLRTVFELKLRIVEIEKKMVLQTIWITSFKVKRSIQNPQMHICIIYNIYNNIYIYTYIHKRNMYNFFSYIHMYIHTYYIYTHV